MTENLPIFFNFALSLPFAQKLLLKPPKHAIILSNQLNINQIDDCNRMNYVWVLKKSKSSLAVEQKLLFRQPSVKKLMLTKLSLWTHVLKMRVGTQV